MAQNKSRIVIWSIVGLLVVVAVIFLIVGRQGATPAKPFHADDVPKFTRLMENRIEGVEERAAKVRAEYGSEDAEVFAQADQHLAAAREWLQKMQGTTNDNELGALRDSVQEHYKAARRLLREAD
jgi:hypothetical protein